MANTDNHTIGLQISRESQYVELVANEDIAPGMLVKHVQVAGEEKVIKHDTPYAAAENLYAMENPYQGKTINDVYSADSRVMIHSLRSGDVVLAWYGSANPLTFGMFLASQGDGSLFEAVPASTEPGGVLAVSLEIIAAPAPPERVKVRII